MVRGVWLSGSVQHRRATTVAVDRSIAEGAPEVLRPHGLELKMKVSETDGLIGRFIRPRQNRTRCLVSKQRTIGGEGE